MEEIPSGAPRRAMTTADRPSNSLPPDRPAANFFSQWLILGGALLTLGSATGLNLYLEHERTESREQERLMTQARVVQENIGLNLDSVNKVLAALSRQAAQTSAIAQIDKHLQTLSDGMPGVRTLLVLDAGGTIRASSRPELLGKNYSGRAYFLEPKTHPDVEQLYISAPFHTSLGIFTISVLRMIAGPHGEFAGVVVATLDPQYFTPLLESVRYSPDMWSAIAHDSGDVFLMQPKKEGIEGKNIAQPGTFFSQHRNSGAIATLYAGYAYITGEERLLVWRTVSMPQLKMDRPLLVTVSRDLQTVFAPWKNDLLIQGGLFALIALISSLSLYLYQRRQREFNRQALTNSQTLQNTAERLRLATEATGVGVWDYNPVTGRLDWDASMFKLYGIDPADFSDSYADWSQCIAAADLPVVESALRTAIEEHHIFKSRFHIQRGDGKSRIIKALGQIHYDADNQPVRIVGTNEDITERQQLEDARKESEQRFRATFNAAAIGMALISPEGIFIRSNQALHQIIGYSREELHGKTFHEITHPDDLDNSLRLLQGLHDGEYENYQLEKRYFHKDGHPIWVRLSTSAVRDAIGNPLYFIAQIQDITQDRENQQAVIDSEHFMRKLTDIIPGMVAYWDEHLRCGFANIAYLEWFGKSPEQMQGIHLGELLGPELFAKNEAHIRAALAGIPQHFERTLSKADGSLGYTWAHYIPDLSGERVRGFFVMIADITELKQTQFQLEQRTAEAEAASRSKSQFLANMSHEIRTPMNAILGLLDLLQRTELTPRQYDYAHKVEAAAQSLLGILNDILDFSKVEAGKLELESIPFSLDEVLRNLAVILAASVNERPLEVIFDIDREIPEQLIGDPMRLQQILLNLAGNAIKFTPRGEVQLGVSLRRLNATQAEIDFIVRDTGIGIAADKLSSLFEGFSQAEASTSRRFGGSGLGLAISRHLAQLMKSQLTANSQPGQGSEFRFTVCFGRPAPDSGHATTAAPRRLLIVDDNASSRAALGRMASSSGSEVDQADGGAAGIARVDHANRQQRPYDAVLVDWQMPGMDGWETCQHLRQLPGDGQLPIVLMLSARDREQLAQRQAQQGEQGHTAYLSKPTTPSLLQAAIASACSADGRIAGSARKAPRARPRRLTGLRLLVVEDNPINQQVAQELLAHEGAEVSIASSGQQGIDLIAQRPGSFDAVLMDIQMPGMDGYTATRLIRQQVGSGLPIIAMTANALPQDRQASLDAGMDDHIGKPIDLNGLVATLLRHCRGDSAAAAPTAPTTDLTMHDAATQEALARLGHNYPLFARMVNAFCSQQGDTVKRLQQLLQRGDRTTALRELHSLKGLAATLGARRLARQAAEAEERLRQSDDPSASALLLDSLHPLLESTCGQLEQLAEQLAPSHASGVTMAETERLDPAALCLRLERLEALLAAANLKALDEFAHLKEEFGPALGQHLAALEESMARLDLPAALEKSRNLRSVIAHG
jgi:PAS domain S-box-containing protein